MRRYDLSHYCYQPTKMLFTYITTLILLISLGDVYYHHHQIHFVHEEIQVKSDFLNITNSKLREVGLKLKIYSRSYVLKTYHVHLIKCSFRIFWGIPILYQLE